MILCRFTLHNGHVAGVFTYRKGSVRKNICSYFVSLRKGRGGGGHTKIIVSQLTNLSKCLSRFLRYFVLRTIPQNAPIKFSTKYPPKRGDFDDFFLLSSRSTGLVVKKQGFFPKPLCSPWPFLQFFWKKQGSHVFFFNVHSLEHFDHFLLPTKKPIFCFLICCLGFALNLRLSRAI